MPDARPFPINRAAEDAQDNAYIRARAKDLREDIRETENFLADPRHYTLEPAALRLRELRDEMRSLAILYACSCKRGGNPSTCDCQEVFSV